MFIADVNVSDAMDTLIDLQSMYVKNGQLGVNCGQKQGYAYFVHCLNTLRQASIPVVTINTPW